MEQDDTGYGDWGAVLREAELTARLSPILSSWASLRSMLDAEASRLEARIAEIRAEIEARGPVLREVCAMSEQLQNHVLVLEWQEEYANQLRRAFVVSACSFVESALIDVCLPDSEEESKSYFVELLQMGDRTQELLKRMYPGPQRQESIDDRRWNFLCNVVKLRNFIVHSNGNRALAYKNPTPEHLDNIVASEPGLGWRQEAYSRELVVHAEYCDKVAEMLEHLAPLIFVD